MKQTDTALALVNTTPAQSGAITAPTTTPKPKRAIFRGAQNRLYSQLGIVWQSLTGDERTSWKTVAQSLAKPNTQALPSKVNPYATFVKFNTFLVGAGMDIAITAPTDLTPPFRFPNLTLSGTVGSLTLTASASYGPQVIVYAAPPTLPGNNDYYKASFRKIGSLPGLTVGANNLSALYFAKYRLPSTGYEVVIKLVGVMDSGLHTDGFVLTCINTA